MTAVHPDDLTIHIRTGDVWVKGCQAAFQQGRLPRPRLPGVEYHTLPFSFYARLIEHRRWRAIHVVTEDATDPMVQKLAARFGAGIKSGGVMEDFNFLRASHNLVLSVSTFAWWAGWLSGTSRVYYPVLGFLDPARARLRRPKAQQDLWVSDEDRYWPVAVPAPEGHWGGAKRIGSGCSRADEREAMAYWSDKRVLVTGGTGFLGTHVVESLRQQGCSRLLVVGSRDYDLTTESGAERLFAEARAVDVVFHLAGLVGGIGANQARPADYYYRNLMMGVLTMHQAWRAGVGKFVAAGAGCGYPEAASLPLGEGCFWDGFPQRESAPYSLAKRMLQIQSLAYFSQHRFPSVVCVPGNIYGPHDNFDIEEAHVVPALVRKFVEARIEGVSSGVSVWGSGAPTRDFVYVADVAEGMLRAAELYEDAQLVNLASGKESSIRQVAELLARLSGFEGELVWDASRPDGQRRRVMDVDKARRDLGWTARTSLEEGLRRTLSWYAANREAARNLAAPFAAPFCAPGAAPSGERHERFPR